MWGVFEVEKRKGDGFIFASRVAESDYDFSGVVFKGDDCLAACVALLFNNLVLFLCIRRFILTKPFD